MKKLINKITTICILCLLTLGITPVIKADEIALNNTSNSNIENVQNFEITDNLENMKKPIIPTISFVRGTVGKYGKRPIIYKSQVTAKQWNCYKNIVGAMLLSSPSGPYIILASGLLTLSNCK